MPDKGKIVRGLYSKERCRLASAVISYIRTAIDAAAPNPDGRPNEADLHYQLCDKPIQKAMNEIMELMGCKGD